MGLSSFSVPQLDAAAAPATPTLATIPTGRLLARDRSRHRGPDAFLFVGGLRGLQGSDGNDGAASGNRTRTYALRPSPVHDGGRWLVWLSWAVPDRPVHVTVDHG